MLELVNALTQVHDPRAADLLWELLADANVTSPLGARIESGMLSLYGIEGWNYFGDQFASPAFFWRERRGIEDWNNSQGNQFWAVKIMRRELARAAKPRVAKGSDIQRRVALALLTYADRDEAAEAAENLQADATVRIDVRDEAFVLLLALAPRLRAEEIAAATLSGKYTAKARQKAALAYFVHGPEQRHQRPDGIVFQLDREQVVSSRSGVPIVPKPPSGLEVSQLLPLLHDVEWEVSGEAGYLLTLLGESQGLNPLLQYVDSQENTDRSLQRLAYRAIAALDDSSQIPRLKKIYAGLQQQEKMEFYWTIRIMTGPEILKVRKQIRDEVGIGQIRNVVGPDPF